MIVNWDPAAAIRLQWGKGVRWSGLLFSVLALINLSNGQINQSPKQKREDLTPIDTDGTPEGTTVVKHIYTR
jgi:hypothetical protein